jgi:hypothetical protein
VRLVLSSLLLCVALMALPAPATATASVQPAAAPEWSTPVNVMPRRYSDIDMAIDKHGHIHIVATGIAQTEWRGDHGDVWYATNRSGSWVATKIFAHATGLYWQFPSIALDEHDRIYVAADRVHCAFAEGLCGRSTGHRGIWYLTDSGRTRGTFGSPLRLTPDQTGAGSLAVAQGHLYLAYEACSERSCYLDTTDIRFGTDAAGAWKTVVVSDRGKGPQLALAPDGTARIAYMGPHWYMWLASSSEGTGGLSTSRVPGSGYVEDIDTVSLPPRLAVASDGSAHLTWVKASDGEVVWGDLYYTREIASGWASVQRVAQTRRVITDADIAVARNGVPHLALAKHRWDPYTDEMGTATVKELRLAHGSFVSSAVIRDDQVTDVAVSVRQDGKAFVAFASYRATGLWVSHD